MKKGASLKQRLISALLVLAMMITSLLGTTFAWFTDTVKSEGNKIESGTLKIDLLHLVDGEWTSIKDDSDHKIFDYDKWEPGYTGIETLKIQNQGSLSLKYRLSIEIAKDSAKLGNNGENLADVIDVYVLYGDTAAESFSEVKDSWIRKGTLTEVLKNPAGFIGGQLLPTGRVLEDGASNTTAVGSQIVQIALHMSEDAGNEYQDLSVGDIFVNLVATQWGNENDSFGNDYDSNVNFPAIEDYDVVIPVTTVDGTVNTTVTEGNVTIPRGVKVKNGVTTLGAYIKEKDHSDSNISIGDDEIMRPLDVHVEGIAPDNTVPIIIDLGEVMPAGLNIGNYTLYHVENGVNVAMVAVANVSDLDEHNEFYYDPATGIVVVAMATFSEVAILADTVNAWEGNFDYTWYDASKTELTIANADQLAAFGAIVGGMKKVTGRVEKDDKYEYTYAEEIIEDSFKGKIVKLISDIDLGDIESENNPNIIFYPIGYYNEEGIYEKTQKSVNTYLKNFEGTFDGNGNTIANFYQNTWEMKGDNSYYDLTLQYYREGMGLFGRVYGGTVKNLTVKNFSSDGEYTTTGAIAAYADGAIFENIAIFDCNPRVYNIGNGGIVGCVGWYAKEANLKTTFKNVTVDNSNKISALWGSYDVACGGIVGQYYPTSGQTSADKPANGGISFENCHIAAQMDVYNDVCANYQYYAYRYTGMLIGSVRENVTIDGHTYPKMDGISAKDCTVHFGTWNDYYYCEIIDNTTASYTHDYQMSRLTEIKAIDGTTITYLDGTTGTVPASGRANYVIVDYNKGHGTENATCYHFKDGNVWNHEDGGYHDGTDGGKIIDENGDGNPDLREDKQHIYLEFNNLVTGYGWGVTSRGLDNLDGVTNLDITSTDHEKSVEKFEGKVNELANNKIYKLGDIFTFVDKGVKVIPGALTVSVVNTDDNNPVSATIEYDPNNWENGTIKFTGIGKVTITIQDYYFCTPTTITVNVTDRQSEEKFDIVMNNGDFLHRVGNSGNVPLDKLFKAKDGVTVGTISVTVEAVNGTSASGTYSNNVIDFNGTGVVKVTITDNDFCTPTVLYLEVVDAVNATGATSATSNNVVLLNDCGFSSLDVSGGYTFYGNGFTLTCGSDSPALDMGYAFVTLENGTLDNVQIVCPKFDFAALYKSQLESSDNRSQTTDRTRYYNAKSGVMVSGNSQILNSRISGARAAVNVVGGNCVIDNSRLEGGVVATLLVGAANSLTLRDVTLIQKPTVSTYDSNKTLMGMSVLYLCDADGNATSTTLEGDFVQYAWADSSCTSYMPTGTSSIASTVLSKTNYTHTVNGKTCVNLGFAYMPSDGTTVNEPNNITDNRTDKNTIPYSYEEVKASVPSNGLNVNIKTHVYSYKNTSGTNDEFTKINAYTPNKYGDIITVNYSDTKDGLEPGKSFGTDGWVYELNVDLDKAPGYKLDFSKLSMVVNGVPVTDYKVNGSAKPTSPVAVTAGGVTYTITAIKDGKEYTATYKVTGVETTKKAPEFTANWSTSVRVTNGSSEYSIAAEVLTGITVKYWSVKNKDYVVLDLTELTPTETKPNGTNSYWEYVDPNGDFTLKITNTAAINSNKGVYGMPVVYSNKLYFTVSSTSGMVSTGTASRSLAMQYVFKDNNGGETIINHTWTVAKDATPTIKYSDMVPSEGGGTGCVTPDTLITLADGTQVRVDSLTGNEMLLVWNMETGRLDYAPIMFIDSDPELKYEVVKLYFSDGTCVNVIYEHGFWDYDLNKYVYLDSNAAEYIGHTFAKQNGDTLEKVTLVDVVIETELTTAWSPVTAGHLCYFVNGMLSMPGGVGGLFNIFEVDAETMTYDYEQMEKDIETYGLYTYEELNAICPLSEEMFIAAGGAYLKISIGKGNLTEQELYDMINRYNKFFE